MTNLKIISAKISRFRIKNAEWVALGRIDAALKNDRMLDTSLSIVARSDDVE